jgi:hypothetical protein
VDEFWDRYRPKAISQEKAEVGGAIGSEAPPFALVAIAITRSGLNLMWSSGY